MTCHDSFLSLSDARENASTKVTLGGGGVHAEEVGPMDSWISAVILHFSNIGK